MNPILSSSHLEPFFFTSCGIQVTLISGRTILERQLVHKDVKTESALCCGEGVQTAINRTCVIILGYVTKWLTTISFLNINNCFSSLRIQAGDVQLCWKGAGGPNGERTKHETEFCPCSKPYPGLHQREYSQQIKESDYPTVLGTC